LLYNTNKKNIITKDYIKECIPSVEDVNVVGYPDSIGNSINNLPIVRKDITVASLKYDVSEQTNEWISIYKW